MLLVRLVLLDRGRKVNLKPVVSSRCRRVFHLLVVHQAFQLLRQLGETLQHFADVLAARLSGQHCGHSLLDMTATDGTFITFACACFWCWCCWLVE